MLPFPKHTLPLLTKLQVGDLNRAICQQMVCRAFAPAPGQATGSVAERRGTQIHLESILESAHQLRPTLLGILLRVLTTPALLRKLGIRLHDHQAGSFLLSTNWSPPNKGDDDSLSRMTIHLLHDGLHD